jgi:hypothetical protein
MANFRKFFRRINLSVTINTAQKQNAKVSCKKVQSLHVKKRSTNVKIKGRNQVDLLSWHQRN